MKKSNSKPALLITTILFVMLFSCSKPYDRIKNKTWSGQIYRLQDEKELSDVRLKMSNDTLYIFANAIFGANNDTLLFDHFEKKDSTLNYHSLNGELYSFQFKYVISEDVENLYLVGNDYFIFLISSVFDIKDKNVLDFYKNINVPRDAYMYLDGTYKGELEIENQFSNLLLASMGGASIKMVFLDGFQVKIFFESLLTDMFVNSSNSPDKIVNYTVDDNKLILENNNSKARIIEVMDYGKTLVFKTEDLNVVMHKTY